MIDAVITVTKPIPSSITTAARMLAEVGRGDVRRRSRPSSPSAPPTTCPRPSVGKSVVVDDRHQPAGEERDRRRHGRDHDRGLARVDGVLDQPVEPALECVSRRSSRSKFAAATVSPAAASSRRSCPELADGIASPPMCCLALSAGFIGPRFALLLWWIFGNKVDAAFSSWIWPLLGLALPAVDDARLRARVGAGLRRLGLLGLAARRDRARRRHRDVLGALGQSALRDLASLRRPTPGRGRSRRGVRRRAPSTTAARPRDGSRPAPRALSAATFSGATNTCTRPRPSSVNAQSVSATSASVAIPRPRAAGTRQQPSSPTRCSPSASIISPRYASVTGSAITRWRRLPSRRHVVVERRPRRRRRPRAARAPTAPRQHPAPARERRRSRPPGRAGARTSCR